MNRHAEYHLNTYCFKNAGGLYPPSRDCTHDENKISLCTRIIDSHHEYCAIKHKNIVGNTPEEPVELWKGNI